MGQPNPGDQAMSRKLALTFAALGTLASAALIAGSANAMIVRGGNGGHGGHGGPPIHIIVNHGHPHFYHHYRYVWRHGHVRAVDYVARDPGPCTCLTKEYTPEGIVVFRDLCTKEMASAPVDGAPVQGGQAADPNNFAGKTYQDYLAANPQAKPLEPQKN
jgi:hypothetical protein